MKFEKKAFLILVAFLLLIIMACNSEKNVAVDGYPTVKIGNQVWMAKNLNIETEGSWCYDNNYSNCEKYGRLYTWDAAMNACPTGWHLPGKDEFDELVQTVGGNSVAVNTLKSSMDWEKGGNGADTYGFSALPAGRGESVVIPNGETMLYFLGKGFHAGFWSSSVSGSVYVYALQIMKDASVSDFNRKILVFSVRCVKD